jgi:hypothetical protein
VLASLLTQYSSEPRRVGKSGSSAHAGIVSQEGCPGLPHAEHVDTEPTAIQILPALQAVPQHGLPATPHPPEELPPLLPPDADPPPLLPEPDPLLLLPEPDPPPLLLPEAEPPLVPDPPLLEPLEPASAAPVAADLPPHPRSDRTRNSPHAATRRSRFILRTLTRGSRSTSPFEEHDCATGTQQSHDR